MDRLYLSPWNDYIVLHFVKQYLVHWGQYYQHDQCCPQHAQPQSVLYSKKYCSHSRIIFVAQEEPDGHI